MYASYSPARSGRAVNSRDFVSTISGATVSLYNEVHVSTSSTASPMTTPSKLNRTEESPLLKGSLYSRVQGETFHGHDDLHVTSLTLAQLYSHAYVPYVQRQQAEALSSSSPPSRPLEFDGETPVSIEDARQYIRDLAVMYRTKFRDPTPCQLYEELVRRAMESGMAEDKAVSGRSEEDLTTDDQPPALWLPKGYGGMVDSSLRCHRVTPSAEVLTHAMSFWLLSIKDVTNPECVIESIKQSKGEVLTLFPSVVMRCLGFVREVVRDDNVSSGRKEALCSLLGFVVAPRRNINEILEYVSILEELYASSATGMEAAILPHYDDFLGDFAMVASTRSMMVSPVDAYHGYATRLPLVLPEGSYVITFCVSPCGRLMAVATVAYVMLLEVSTGKSLSRTTDADMVKSLWIMQFAPDSSTLILSMSAGRRHVLLSTAMVLIREIRTDSPAIPLVAVDGGIQFLHSPQLPGGGKGSLLLLESRNTVTSTLRCIVSRRVDVFDVCSHFHCDYVGNIIVMEAKETVFAVQVKNGVITISQGTQTCFGVLPSDNSWHFLHCNWERGTWTVSVDAIFVELQGMCAASPTSVSITCATVLGGAGHISSLAVWGGHGPHADAIKNFSSTRVSDPTADMLLYLPLDEGEGMWVKELVSCEVFTVHEQCALWDDDICCPCVPTAPQRRDSFLPYEQLLTSEVMVSDHQVLLVLPSTHAGGDGIVVQVLRGKECISRVYRCPPNHMETCYFLSRDESLLYTLERHPSTFCVTAISTRAGRERQLNASGIAHTDARQGSAEWVCNEVLKRVCISSMDILRAPKEVHIARIEDLQHIDAALNGTTRVANRIKLLSVATVGLVYVERLMFEDINPLSCIVASLNHSCTKILGLFPDSLVRGLAFSLFRVGEGSLLTPMDKVNVLLNVDSGQWGNVVHSCMQKESLLMILSFVIDDEPSKIISIATNLLRRCEMERGDVFCGRKIFHLMWCFSIISVQLLHSRGHGAIISQLIEVYVQHSERVLVSCGWGDSMQQTEVHTAFLPLIISVSVVCPETVTPTIERSLLSLMESAPTGTLKDLFTVSFQTRQSCVVVPAAAGAPYRLVQDYTRATSVTISRETSVFDMRVLVALGSAAEPTTAVLNDESPHVEVPGSSLVVFGVGKVSFTIVGNYTLYVGVAWSVIFREAIFTLLGNTARHLAVFTASPAIPPAGLLHGGLSNEVLLRYGLQLPSRTHDVSPALDILTGVGSGKELMDSLWEDAARVAGASMRPVFAAVLSLLIHAGMDRQLAVRELRSRWFLLEWGNAFQGIEKEAARQSLVSLAEWMVCFCVPRGGGFTLRSLRDAYAKRSLTDDTSSILRSASASDERSPRSQNVVKVDARGRELMDQLRELSMKGVTSSGLEVIMVQRTFAALDAVRGLRLVRVLLEVASSGCDTRMLHIIMDVVWHLCEHNDGRHIAENLNGCGVDLESLARIAFHDVLNQCQRILMARYPRDTCLAAALTTPANDGILAIQLLVVLCCPLDPVDCELFSSGDVESCVFSILQQLEEQMHLPAYGLPLLSPWQIQGEENVSQKSKADQLSLVDFVGGFGHHSIQYLTPNGFSVAIPKVHITVSEIGVAVEKTIVGALVLRADEPWDLTLPVARSINTSSVFYYEVTLRSLCHDFVICLNSFNNSIRRLGDMDYFYGSSGSTHTATFPSFGEGDTIGCGIILATRQVFFTLNGVLVSYAGCVHVGKDRLFPTIHINSKEPVSFVVNFGSAAFAYDLRRLCTTPQLNGNPSLYTMACVTEIAMYCLTAHACSLQNAFQPNSRLFWVKCCEVVCRGVNKLTSCVAENNTELGGGINRWAEHGGIFAVAEASLLRHIAMVRTIVQTTKAQPLPNPVSTMLLDTVRLLLTSPMSTAQLAAARLIPELVSHVDAGLDPDLVTQVTRTLFHYARVPAAKTEDIPFAPRWWKCDPRVAVIAHAQLACVRPEKQRSIVLGNVLPPTGTTSFTVRVCRKGHTLGSSLKGGYYVGIAVASLALPISAVPGRRWKTAKPPVVWALHDTLPQLSHAANPQVMGNEFNRVFGNGELIRVVVHRGIQAVDFYREDVHLSTLFVDIPSDIDLVPFVQLYNDDAFAFIGPGETKAPIGSSDLLKESSLDALRSMAAQKPFETRVSEALCGELDESTDPSVSLAVLGGTPYLRAFKVTGHDGEPSQVRVCRLLRQNVRVSAGGASHWVHLSSLYEHDLPSEGAVLGEGRCNQSVGVLQQCVKALVGVLRRLALPLVTTQALTLTEERHRRRVVGIEREELDNLLQPIRVWQFCRIQQLTRSITFLEPPQTPKGYCFSSALSHPGFHFPARFCGRLATVPGDEEGLLVPFIAVAEPSVPLRGKFQLRFQLVRGHIGQILGGGYYVGLCTALLGWRWHGLSSGSPQAWVLHDMDDAPWRLPHLCSCTQFQTVAEPKCIIVSGDIIRLEIDRCQGTMYAFRKGMNAEEVPLGLLYDNIPSGVELFPFIQLYNADAVAVLLPAGTDETAVRTAVQRPHLFASLSPLEKRCDVCSTVGLHATDDDPRLYRCNKCIDYQLCRHCFELCMHPRHSFTEFGSRPLIHSPSPPGKLTVGMNVVVAATSALYIKSEGCHVDQRSLQFVAVSEKRNSLAVWGIVHKGKAVFTAMVKAPDGQTLTSSTPTFIGVGRASDVLVHSAASLRSLLASKPLGMVALCNDSSLNPILRRPGRSARGFRSGSTVSIEVDFLRGEVLIQCDWLSLGVQSTEILRGDGATSPDLVGFVLFGQENVTASICPEATDTVHGVVSDVVDGFVQVLFGDGRWRVLRREHCCLPLMPPTEAPKVGQLGYTFSGEKLFQCKVKAAEGNEVSVLFLTSDVGCEVIPLSNFHTDRYGAITEEFSDHSTFPSCGPTVTEGFVISRILLVLSTMCSNSQLSPYVISHYSEIVDVLSCLASVRISSDIYRSFFSDVEEAVATTHRCSKTLELMNERLSGFVPQPPDLDQTYALRCNMLLCVLNGPCRGRILRVVKLISASAFEGVDIQIPHSAVLMNTAACIPVKQCDGKPWWTVGNGLPCTQYEYGLRMTCANVATGNMTVKGVWEGEINVRGEPPGSISMNLGAGYIGEACAYFCGVYAKYFVIGVFERSSRSFSLILFSAASSVTYRAVCSLTGESNHRTFEELVEQVELILSGESQSGVAVLMEGTVDADGSRVVGSWKPKLEKAGVFAISCTDHLALSLPVVGAFYVEPLPSLEELTDVVPRAMQSRRENIKSALRRLVVLLSRHLCLFFLDVGNTQMANLTHVVICHHAHPVTERLLAACGDMTQLQLLLHKVSSEIACSSTRPQVCVALASLLTKCVLLRSEVISSFPSVFWDSFHAIVTATHRCTGKQRYYLLKCITRLVEHCGGSGVATCAQLLSVLLGWVDQYISNHPYPSEIPEDVAAGVELAICLPQSVTADIVRHIPVASLRCLVETARALREKFPLPKAVDMEEDAAVRSAPSVQAVCEFGELSDGLLLVGKVMSCPMAAAHGKYYYEVALPDGLPAQFAVGWGTERHRDIPAQHVGSDVHSFAFTGSGLSFSGREKEYKPGREPLPGCVIGCLLNMDKDLVAWSVDGVCGPFVSIPIDRGGKTLIAFVSTGPSNGVRIRLNASEFEDSPVEYSDLSGCYTHVRINDHDTTTCRRSSLSPTSVSFYEQLASYLSEVEDNKLSNFAGNELIRYYLPSIQAPGVPEVLLLRKYPLLIGLTEKDVRQHTNVIRVIESCMKTARPYLNLGGEVVESHLSDAFLFLKCAARRSLMRRHLAGIPSARTNPKPHYITVRSTELYGGDARTYEVALQRSVLSQIYKQIGCFSPEQFVQQPLFKVHLRITHSGHTPQDLGGPYRQLWTFLSEEMMTPAEGCYPNTAFHRNPLFCFGECLQRVGLIPNRLMTSRYNLELFNFLGKLMGHSAVAKIPFALDMSPFLWKYLVGDTLTVRDYYRYVDGTMENCVASEAFLLSTEVEEAIPTFAENSSTVGCVDMDVESKLLCRRKIAENCLIHSLDVQLNVIREGLWSVLPRHIVRCLSWRALEHTVCGEPDLTPEVMRRWVDVRLEPPRDKMFWRAIDEFSVPQRALFMCFGCGQKRPPLAEKIKVVQSFESTDYLPRAQTCSSSVTIPPYDTYELLRDKLTVAIAHSMEMELA